MYQNTELIRHPKPTWASTFRLLSNQTKRIGVSDTKLNVDTIPQKTSTNTDLTMTMFNQDIDKASTPSLSSESSFSSCSYSSLEDDMSLHMNRIFEHLSSTDDETELQVKSQTCPEISLIASISTTSIELCSQYAFFKQNTANKVTRAATLGRTQLKRAATWLGLAGQRLRSSQNVLGQFKKHQLEKSLQWQGGSSKEFVYGTSIDHINFIKQQIEKSTHTITAPKRIMSCKVQQIINLASSRECEYELQIQLNNTTISSKRGTMHKHEKGVSTDKPYTEPLVFEIEEPFSLNFVVAARHTNTVLRDKLAKMGIWPIQQTKAANQLPIVGYSCMSFENKMDVLEHGVSRFKLIRSNNRSASRGMNIELVVDIEVKDMAPPSIKLSESQEIVNSLKHCQRGDYLTIYTKTSTHAIWKRYWAVLKYDQLELYDFCFKEYKEPLFCISLAALKTVDKPSMDDCELVGLSRNPAIVFDFDTTDMPEDDVTGKMFVYADSECNATDWQRGLTAHITQHRNIPKDNSNFDLRFIW